MSSSSARPLNLPSCSGLVIPITISSPKTSSYQVGFKICPGVVDVFKELAQTYSFFPEAQKRIFTVLGENDLKKGESLFKKLVAHSNITIERVGLDKENHPKFYLMVMEKGGLDGGFNTFHRAFSRRGTPRAVTRLKTVDAREVIQRGIEHAEQLKKTLQKGKRGVEGISRLMSHENGVKVSELGSCDLWGLSDYRKGNVAQSERLLLYQDIFRGLTSLHEKGLIHRDIKPSNIVALCGLRFRVLGAKIIDLDFLAEQEQIGEYSGAIAYWSPEKMRRFLSKLAASESEKADVWSAMYTICELEAWIDGHYVTRSGLSKKFLSRFLKYDQRGFQYLEQRKKESYCRSRIAYIEQIEKKQGPTENLFQGLNPITFMDQIVFAAAYVNPEKRKGAKDILTLFENSFTTRALIWEREVIFLNHS